MFSKIIHSDHIRKEIFWMSLTVLAACVCVYVYCITATVRNIVENKTLAIQTTNISEQISTKEFQLISLQNTITLQYAATLGFSDPTVKSFVSPQRVSFVY